MKSCIIILSIGFLLLGVSCKKKSNTDDSTNPPVATNPTSSVETLPPNSNYKSAFVVQTRIAAVKTATSYRGTVLTSGLTAPWGITALPDGRFLITEKAGNMRIVTEAQGIFLLKGL